MVCLLNLSFAPLENAAHFIQFTANYIGPGAGLSAIGSVLAFFGVLVLIVFGFIWYPFKRLIRKISRNQRKNKNEE